MTPRPEEADKVMDAVVSQTSGAESPVAQLMQNGSDQQAASMAYSLTTELNVPTELVNCFYNNLLILFIPESKTMLLKWLLIFTCLSAHYSMEEMLVVQLIWQA